MREGPRGWENAAPMHKSSILVLAAALAACGPAIARTTVCTITVNSADEREAFRRNLPPGEYDFVELVERGRPDWLASSCRRGVECDVLVVSGHFAGTEFYSSRPQENESLAVDELERVTCGESCSGLFAHLKEVYLFGCDSLKAEPVRSAMPEVIRGLVKAGQSRDEAERYAARLSERHAESARERMRRVFANVPLIYGFSALAPYGRVAGPMLNGYFQSGPDEEVGSGRASARLLKLFGPSSMVATRGASAVDRGACRLYDERVSEADKLEEIHRMLAAEPAEVRMAFDTAEKFIGAITPRLRADPAFASALGALAADEGARTRYLSITRETEDPALRARMIALGAAAGWLDAVARRDEQVRMIGDMLASDAVGFGEVELICSLNEDRALDAAAQRATPQMRDAPRAAALACLGNGESHARVLRALASADEREVQVAQAYLRHRPITDPRELRAVALGIASMKGSGAQVRALEVLARHHVTDREVLDELARLFPRTQSLQVQRAIAEVFMRAGREAYPAPALLAVLRHRLPSPGGDDLIDALVSSLQSS
jgi:hypothetical protein